MKLVMMFLFFVGAAYLIVVFNWSYSDGNRAGYIQKFSTKGWMCKTHERGVGNDNRTGNGACSLGIYDLGR